MPIISIFVGYTLLKLGEMEAWERNAEAAQAAKTEGGNGKPKKTKTTKSNADMMSELAVKGGQGFVQLESRVRALESVNFECIQTCETDPVPEIIKTTGRLLNVAKLSRPLWPIRWMNSMVGGLKIL